MNQACLNVTNLARNMVMLFLIYPSYHWVVWQHGANVFLALATLLQYFSSFVFWFRGVLQRLNLISERLDMFVELAAKTKHYSAILDSFAFYRRKENSGLHQVSDNWIETTSMWHIQIQDWVELKSKPIDLFADVVAACFIVVLKIDKLSQKLQNRSNLFQLLGCRWV